MSEIIICYDYNGGYIVKHHYAPEAPRGFGRSVDAAMEDFIRKSKKYILSATGAILIGDYEFCYMPGVSGAGELEQRIREWTSLAERVRDTNGWIERKKCECCGSWVYPNGTLTDSY